MASAPSRLSQRAFAFRLFFEAPIAPGDLRYRTYRCARHARTRARPLTPHPTLSCCYTSDQFIYEYVGEVVEKNAFMDRMKKYGEEGIRHFYFMELQKDEVRPLPPSCSGDFPLTRRPPARPAVH